MLLQQLAALCLSLGAADPPAVRPAGVEAAAMSAVATLVLSAGARAGPATTACAALFAMLQLSNWLRGWQPPWRHNSW